MHLDALRGIAALVVVLGHTRSLYFTSASGHLTGKGPSGQTAVPTLPPSLLPASDARITIGNEAVMIFFVLSGFLVGGSVLKAHRKGSWSWKSYLTKRLTRLWVVLIPALLVGCALDRAGMALFGLQSIYGSPPGQLIVTGDLASRLGISTLLGVCRA